ncbi:MAG: deoxyhypusine synthase [archaeon]
MEKIRHYAPKTLNRLEGHTDIKGHDFSKDQTLQEFITAYDATGLQAANLSKGTGIINDMLEKKATICLSMTSNIISSGLRDIITYLVKNKKVQLIVTSAGGVEEDIIKCLGTFKLGNFDIPGKVLAEQGISRIGNILVPDDRYAYFDQFFTPLLSKLYEHKTISVTQLTKALGLAINDESSYLYWAAKHDIPVFCPGIMDGSIGDLIYYFLYNHRDFVVDVAQDHKRIIDFMLAQENVGCIFLGGGMPKHYVLNANIFRGGADSAVYITTATEHDGSDSGGNPEEAKTWAKLKVDSVAVKIVAEASIVFPLIVAGSFARQ